MEINKVTNRLPKKRERGQPKIKSEKNKIGMASQKDWKKKKRPRAKKLHSHQGKKRTLKNNKLMPAKRKNIKVL